MQLVQPQSGFANRSSASDESGDMSRMLTSAVLFDLVWLRALTLLVGRQEWHPAHKRYGEMVEVGTG